MVSTTKRSAKKPAKKSAKPAAIKRPDFDKGMKVAERVIRENVDWLKEMAKR